MLCLELVSMRYFVLVGLFFTTLFLNAQVSGDITNDDIIDANDYLLLKEKIVNRLETPLIDFDDDN